MNILGIETSCDETAAAVVASNLKVRANVVASQIKLHAATGGVVPEVAARAHTENIIPVVEQALRDARLKPAQIDGIAVTRGPGLVTALLVGVQTAKALAYAWQKPLIGINHIEGHIYATLFDVNKHKGLGAEISLRKANALPAVILTVSGGHTELALIKSAQDLKRLGATVDDAAGEAFDKVAQLLGYGYPGGPAIARAAEKGQPQQYELPRPKLTSADYDFSFSGLKTAVLYKIRALEKKGALTEKVRADMAASFQQAVLDVLIGKTMRAARAHRAKTVMLTGGVAANQALRAQLEQAAAAEGLRFIVPPINFCTDNAVMIAAAAFSKLKHKELDDWQTLSADTTLSLSDLAH